MRFYKGDIISIGPTTKYGDVARFRVTENVEEGDTQIPCVLLVSARGTKVNPPEQRVLAGLRADDAYLISTKRKAVLEDTREYLDAITEI